MVLGCVVWCAVVLSAEVRWKVLAEGDHEMENEDETPPYSLNPDE